MSEIFKILYDILYRRIIRYEQNIGPLLQYQCPNLWIFDISMEMLKISGIFSFLVMKHRTLYSGNCY